MWKAIRILIIALFALGSDYRAADADQVDHVKATFSISGEGTHFNWTKTISNDGDRIENVTISLQSFDFNMKAYKAETTGIKLMDGGTKKSFTAKGLPIMYGPFFSCLAYEFNGTHFERVDFFFAAPYGGELKQMRHPFIEETAPGSENLCKSLTTDARRFLDGHAFRPEKNLER